MPDATIGLNTPGLGLGNLFPEKDLLDQEVTVPMRNFAALVMAIREKEWLQRELGVGTIGEAVQMIRSLTAQLESFYAQVA